MKKILMSLLTSAFVAVVAVGATHAYFSDSVSLTGITFSSGTADLQISQVCQHEWFDNTVSQQAFNYNGTLYQGCQFNFAAGSWYPGKDMSQALYLRNNSTDNIPLATTVQLKNYTQTNGLGNVMSMKIWWNGNATGTDWHSLSYYVSHPQALTTLNPGQALGFTVEMKMDPNAGNSYQNGTVNFDFYFDGVQTH